MKADDTTLGQLMGLAQQGDREAYAAVLNASQNWLKRYYARRVNPAQLDDLVQETLLSLHRKRASFDANRPFLPWLAAIARYRWVDHLRLLYKAELVNMDDADLASFDEEPGVTARISLEKLLTNLSSAQVAAIELVKIEGLSISEASRQTGQSESLIKVNIHRGLKRLAALIEKD